MIMPSETLCSYCLKCFSRPSSLLEHERSHTGERPYRCPSPHCNKSFARKDYLTSHVKTHSEKRNHYCTEPLAGSQETGCGKAFHRRSDLMRHRRRIHGNAQYRQKLALQTHPTRSHLRQSARSSGSEVGTSLAALTSSLSAVPPRPRASPVLPPLSPHNVSAADYQQMPSKGTMVDVAAAASPMQVQA